MEKRGSVPLTMSALWRSLLLVTAVGLMVLAADPTHAARLRRANVTLEGYVGQAPEGVRPSAQLVLRSGSDTHSFALTRSRAVTGNRSGRQLLEDIRPFQNTLVLQGATETLSVLVNASPGQRLVINGFHATGTRTLHVNRIEAVPPDPTPAPAKP